jgi:hypothetical protein
MRREGSDMQKLHYLLLIPFLLISVAYLVLAASTPTSIMCNGVGCNITSVGNTSINCSGGGYAGENITYRIYLARSLFMSSNTSSTSPTTNVCLATNGGAPGACYSHIGIANINDGNYGTSDDSWNGCASNPEWWEINWTSATIVDRLQFKERVWGNGWISTYEVDYLSSNLTYYPVSNLVKNPASMPNDSTGDGRWYNASFKAVSTKSLRFKPYHNNIGGSTFTSIWEMECYFLSYYEESGNVTFYNYTGNHTQNTVLNYNFTGIGNNTRFSNVRCDASNMSGTILWSSNYTISTNLTYVLPSEAPIVPGRNNTIIDCASPPVYTGDVDLGNVTATGPGTWTIRANVSVDSLYKNSTCTIFIDKTIQSSLYIR